jgi:prepilin peptidase CpaA
MHEGQYLQIFNFTITVLAVVLCISIFFTNLSNQTILFASFYLAVISTFDAIFSKIPNNITLPFCILALMYNTVISGWGGVVWAFTGAVSGLGLLLPIFLLGGMGAGDVKALAALGALMGPKDILQIFLYMGIVGGVIGLMYFVVSGRMTFLLSYISLRFKEYYLFKDIQPFKAGKGESGIRFPYAIAIAFGFSIYVFRGDIF